MTHSTDQIAGRRPRELPRGIPGFPRLFLDLTLVLSSAVAGALIAQVFRWNPSEPASALSAPQILQHNLLIAALASIITLHAARGMMLLNGLWLGMGITASTHMVGAGRTLALTIAHVPLEVIAWAMTIELARRFWPTLRASARHDPAGRGLCGELARCSALTALLYTAAACAEGVAFSLIEGS